MDLIAARTESMPRILWLELTSRCPFDCVFCSRASLRGAGQHLDFELYRRLLGELERPQIIRLNYAGESAHYPRLVEAVALAAATGAQVELVSALASFKPDRLQATLAAGLNRLTVSLHTLDPHRFRQIYRFGQLESLLLRLDEVLAWRERSPQAFLLDLAFVAMQDNLDELPAIAAFAASRDIPVLAVHPLIGRDPLPMGPTLEHQADGGLAPEFRTQLQTSLARARKAAPGLSIQLSSHELLPHTELAAHPQPWPWPLPTGAAVSGCEQSPFDSVHVLADGRVVACEVTEKLSLGKLHEASLKQIWQRPAYVEFRAQHQSGHAACANCIYKSAHRPQRASAQVHGAQAPAEQLLRGWFADDGSGVRWGGSHAALWLPRQRASRLHLRGLLASPDSRRPGSFLVRIDGCASHRQTFTTSTAVDLQLRLPPCPTETVVVELECPEARSPHALGAGADMRELGFALIEARLL